jgi:hypothetical protein
MPAVPPIKPRKRPVHWQALLVTIGLLALAILARHEGDDVVAAVYLVGAVLIGYLHEAFRRLLGATAKVRPARSYSPDTYSIRFEADTSQLMDALDRATDKLRETRDAAAEVLGGEKGDGP